ncbi:SCO family protein [Alcaligenaceae bacterium]|nr:SCO family protein [Alcaligenaceae bacterium]
MSNTFFTRRSLIAAGVAMLTLPVFTACSSDTLSDLNGSDISGTGLGKEMVMQDSSGASRTLADYKNKVVVVFFGFTHCPDVCPTALSELAQAMELLGKDADQVQVLMVSVDPARDTPEILASYTTTFHPSFIGLSGTNQQLETTAKSFRAYYAKVAGPTPDQYSMDHSSSFYVFDKKGEVRILLGGNAPADEIAQDIRQLI